jgi:hypothetical protein
MKPIMIKKILDLAVQARNNGDIYNPMFTGDAGLGKSAVCQQWVADQRAEDPNFGFLDLRIAYLESPDLIGFPEMVYDADGVPRTVHSLPNFWPTSGKGLLLIEEPNRGTTGVMNCLMQLLTDYKVHQYTLPKGWIVASCINPDSAEYDVNAMDAALRNRFVEYDIEYDHNTFVDYMETRGFHQNVIMFVKSGAWIFKDTKAIGRDGKYISPRTWAQMNAVEQSGIAKNREMHHTTSMSILGKDIGKEYHKFIFDESPVLAKDLLDNLENAIDKLKKQSDPSEYRGDMIGITLESICKNYVPHLEDDHKLGKVGEGTMVRVAMTIPSDQAVNLIKQCGATHYGSGVGEYFKRLTTQYPELVEVLKSNIKVTRAISTKK